MLAFCFSAANARLCHLAYMSTKGNWYAVIEHTQGTGPSANKRVSGTDVGVTGTASVPELITTAQKPMIEQIQTRENGSSLSTAELDQLADCLDQLPTEIKNADSRTIPHFAEKLDNFLADGTFFYNWPSDNQIQPRFDLGGFIFQTGIVFIQYGVPAYRIVSGISTLGKVWGGISGIKWALRSGHAELWLEEMLPECCCE